jgi:thermitase
MARVGGVRWLAQTLSFAVMVALVSAWPCGFARASGDGDAAATTRLIVRPRVGVFASKQERLLARQGARWRRHLARLDAVVVDVPRRKAARVMAALRRSGAFSDVEEDVRTEAAGIPDDPLFSWEWPAVRINTVESWSVTLGSPGMPVAVVDSGVDASHPDLQGQVLPGYDFVNDDDDPSDDNGHGTAMAGIIAARADNGIGIAGIAPASQVLPVKVLDANGSGYYSTLAEGILWAVDHGAKVISLSLTGPAPSSALQSAIDYARAHEVIVVAAAGNNANSTPTYPAAYEGVVAVAASDYNDQRAWFSSYGSWVSLAAPGMGVMSTKLGGDYGGVSGTSPATALASGAFALLLSADPSLSATDAVTRMTANAVDLGTQGWDPYFGFGRIDAYAALVPGQVVRHVPDHTYPVVKLLSPANLSLVYGLMSVDLSATDNVGVTHVDLIVDQRRQARATVPPFAFAWDTTAVSPGRHTLEVIACDAAGNCAASSRVRVDVTSGVGLLVKRSVIRFGRKPATDAFSVNAMFALPDGEALDPQTDAVDVELTDADGAVFATAVPAASMTPSRTGAMRAQATSTSPVNGDVTVKIVRNRRGNGYHIKLSGHALSLGSVAVGTMNLRVTVGSEVLSQSLSFRTVRNRMVVP